MPTLIIEGVPVSLYVQIQHLAERRRQTPADAALDVLRTAFPGATSPLSEAPMPDEPFLTSEISAPCDIPRPVGRPARAVRVAPPLPNLQEILEEG